MAQLTIAVIGLGYVGCINCACLADMGHTIIGVDIDPNKIHLINTAQPTIIEADIADVLKRNISRISATSDMREAIRRADVSLLCVGTPNGSDGKLDLSALYRVVDELAEGIQQKNSFHTVAVRSTIPPGTCASLRKLLAQMTGKLPGKDFDVVANPEFLREGSAVHDYQHPPFTVVGLFGESPKAAAAMRHVYAPLSDRVEHLEVSIGNAELIKFVNNSWHAIKVSFANEIGQICKKNGLDGRELMSLFCKDAQLNISPNYLRPGFAFGGSCLPKDLRGLCAIGSESKLELPLLSSVLRSNTVHVEQAEHFIKSLGRQHIAFLGISFKPGTDDIRNSPKLQLCKKLITHGYSVRVHDCNVSDSLKKGINKKFLLPRLGDVVDLLYDSLDQAISGAELVILANAEPYYNVLDQMLRPEQLVLELESNKLHLKVRSEGVCW